MSGSATTTTMSREEEEEEVRTLLERHQERIRLDLGNTDLLAVLVKNSVLTQSEEDLLLKPYNAGTGQNSAPSSVGVTKRKLSAVISNVSSGSSTVSTTTGGPNSSIGGSGGGGQLSRSASVNEDPTGGQSVVTGDNRSITPSVVVNLNTQSDSISDQYSTKEELNAGDSYNDAELLRLQCANLIEIIAKNGFEKFKQFCYAIENECPQLIEDLINDRLKCGKYLQHAVCNRTVSCIEPSIESQETLYF